jgi:hypothetical protein
LTFLLFDKVVGEEKKQQRGKAADEYYIGMMMMSSRCQAMLGCSSKRDWLMFIKKPHRIAFPSIHPLMIHLTSITIIFNPHLYSCPLYAATAVAATLLLLNPGARHTHPWCAVV